MFHNDVMSWKCLSNYCPIQTGIHRLPVNSPNKWPIMQSFDCSFAAGTICWKNPVNFPIKSNAILQSRVVFKCSIYSSPITTEHNSQLLTGAAPWSSSYLCIPATSYREDYISKVVGPNLSSNLNIMICHYNDVIMTTIASQITSLTVVSSIVYSGADQRKHQSSASLAFVRGTHRNRWIPSTKSQ